MYIDKFRHCVLHCFDVPLSRVVEAIEGFFSSCADRWNFDRVAGQLDIEGIIGTECQAGSWFQKRVALFMPNVVPPGTVMVTNLEDGWASLGCIVSKALDCGCLRIGISRHDDEWPSFFFAFLKSGEMMRLVRAMRDNEGWDFYAEGNVLDCEDVRTYRRRRIRDRITRQSILDLAQKMGYPVGEDTFWKTQEEAIYFIEKVSESPKSCAP